MVYFRSDLLKIERGFPTPYVTETYNYISLVSVRVHYFEYLKNLYLDFNFLINEIHILWKHQTIYFKHASSKNRSDSNDI